MQLHRSVPVAVVLALAVPVAAGAAPSEMKVTGGGQLIDPDAKGVGQTVAFTAQGSGGAGKGQAQFNDHAGTKIHGVVDCVQTGTSDGANVAKIGGTYTDASGAVQRFTIRVVDNGQGADAGDMVEFDQQSDQDCAIGSDESFADIPALGRGNVKIHKASGSPSAEKQPSSSTSSAKAAAPALTTLLR